MAVLEWISCQSASITGFGSLDIFQSFKAVLSFTPWQLKLYTQPRILGVYGHVNLQFQLSWSELYSVPVSLIYASFKQEINISEHAILIRKVRSHESTNLEKVLEANRKAYRICKGDGSCGITASFLVIHWSSHTRILLDNHHLNCSYWDRQYWYDIQVDTNLENSDYYKRPTIKDGNEATYREYEVVKKG